METADLAAMETVDLVAMSTAAIHILGTDQIVAFTSDQFDALTANQIGALSSTQAMAIETADLVAIDTLEIRAFSTAAVHAFTTDQIDALTTEQVHALTTAQILALSTDDIVALHTDGLFAFSTQQLAALTTDQYAAITTDQFAALSSTDIAAMTTMQAHALSTDQVYALTSDQVHGLETADIAAMTSASMVAFSTEALGEMSAAQIEAITYYSPIVLDLDGNGVQTTAAAHGVNFDLMATGHASKVGWVGAGDALLVRDRNGDGVINNGTELYGGATVNANGQRSGNGYAALAAEDSNHDGKITAADAHFKEMKLWVDANHDGKTDAGELHGLAEFGIVELDLSAISSNKVNNGNAVALVSSYKTADGSSHEMADVWFAKDKAPAKTDVPHISELLAAPQANLLGNDSHASTQPVAAAGAAVAAVVHHGAHIASLKGLLDDDRQVPLI